MRRVVGTIVLILLMWCFGLALIVQAEHSRQDDWTEYIELIWPGFQDLPGAGGSNHRKGIQLGSDCSQW